MMPFKKKSDKKYNSATKQNGATTNNSTALTNSTSPLSNTTTTTTITDDFSARRSARVAVGEYAADNDTWVEALAVCELPPKAGKKGRRSKSKHSGIFHWKNKTKKKNDEMEDSSSANNTTNGNNNNNNNNVYTEEDLATVSQRLILRPYFQSQNTGQRVWDEPPSGASTILYATLEARKMAEAQLEEMRMTYAGTAVRRRLEREERDEDELGGNGGSGSSNSGGWKLSRLFQKKSLEDVNRGTNNDVAVNSINSDGEYDDALLLSSQTNDNNHNRKSNSNSSANNNNSNSNSNNRDRNGIPLSILQESKEMARSDRRSKYEEELQMAMMLSMNTGGGSVMGVGDTTLNSGRSSSSSSSRKSPPPPPPPLYPTAAVVASATAGSNNADNMTTMSLQEQEQKQLAMAIRLSEQQQQAAAAREDNRKPSSSSSRYTRRTSSKKNEYTSISDNLEYEYGEF